MKIVRIPMGIGNTYEGEWSNGAANGHGVLTYSNGDRYEGQWRNDQENGFGVLSFVDGRRYEGNWLNGKKSGHGFICAITGHQIQRNAFFCKIAFLDSHIHRCIKNGMRYFV